MDEIAKRIFNMSTTELSLQEVTTLISQLRLPTAMVTTPTNLADEKAQFFDSDYYNPEFKYKVVDNENDKILSRLEEVELINDVDPRISDFYIKLIASKKLTHEMMSNVGNNMEFSIAAKEKFGLPSPKLFRNATRVLKGLTKNYNTAKPVKGERYMDYEEIKNVWEHVFEYFELDGWHVEPSKNSSKRSYHV